MIKEITSLKNDIVKQVCLLKKNSEIKKQGKFLIEGEHLLSMSLDQLDSVFTLRKLDLNESITQYIVTKEILNKISSSISTPDVIGVARVLNNKIDKNFSIIYLDGVQDPGNVGTIIRTALAFNFKNIILSEDSAFLYNQKVIQSSQGAIFKENIETGNLKTLENLKNKENFKIIGTSLSSKTKKLEEISNFDKKTIIVFGSEGSGIKKEVENLCDELIKIQISSSIDSLNVGVASGIILNYMNQLRKF